MDTSESARSAQLTLGPDGFTVYCAGAWTAGGINRLEPEIRRMNWPDANEVVIDGSGLTSLDTSGAWLLSRTLTELKVRGRKTTLTGFKSEFAALLQLISSCVLPSPQLASPENYLTRIGISACHTQRQISLMLAFIGETAVCLLGVITHPGRIRWRPVLHNIQSAGFEALPIVGLLSFLMGLVIAYQGSDQLQRFGANIFIADLVGLSMLRELSPLLTAIIVAGRSGSAYAAQIGTMKVTEEIDALRTIGITPGELLVLPKLIALVISLPLLTVFADIAGLMGGMIMARSKLDIGFDLFIDRLGDAIHLSSYLTGIAKAPVFACIIALVGCFQGFQVTGSADSVGRQTTVSVVQAIFLVILSDALFSIVFNWLKI